MPGTDSVEATRRIMGEMPCPILVVTATVSGGIGQGLPGDGQRALDAVGMPCWAWAVRSAGEPSLLRKIDVIGRLIGKTPPHTAALPSFGAD